MKNEMLYIKNTRTLIRFLKNQIENGTLPLPLESEDKVKYLQQIESIDRLYESNLEFLELLLEDERKNS